MTKRSPIARVRLARHLLREYEADEARDEAFRRAGGLEAAVRSLQAMSANLSPVPPGDGARRWREASERYAAQFDSSSLHDPGGAPPRT